MGGRAFTSQLGLCPSPRGGTPLWAPYPVWLRGLALGQCPPSPASWSPRVLEETRAKL